MAPNLHNTRLAIEYRQLASLVKYAGNPNKHPGEQINSIAASIEEFGFVFPVVVDAAGVIVAGEAAITAAERLGYVEVPCVAIEHLTAEQVRGLRLAHHRLQLGGRLDEKVFRQEIDQLLRAGASHLVALALSTADVDALLREAALASPSLGLAPQKKSRAAAAFKMPTARPGDTWLLGAHRLICADGAGCAGVDAAIAAWQRVANIEAQLETDGRTFAAIAKERGVAAAA